MWIFQQIGSILCKREREKEKEQYCNMMHMHTELSLKGFGPVIRKSLLMPASMKRRKMKALFLENNAADWTKVLWLTINIIL